MRVGIVGLGYVGLPLAIAFLEAGIKVTGFDVDVKKIDMLKKGDCYIDHINDTVLQDSVSKGTLSVTTDFSLIASVEATIICVPTPLNKYREPDLSFVLNTGRAIAPHLQLGSLVVLESTTYPGTTEGELREVLESNSKLIAGKDFYLAYSPEREDPGNKLSNVKKVPKVLGGFTEACIINAEKLYLQIVNTVVRVKNCKTAEATKLMENIFRSVNIALVNELKVIYEKMDIDIWEVIDAAKTKPFGFMPFYPGPGLGGHCIPIDPFYLTWKAREFGKHTRFIELAGEINTSMPSYVISRVMEALNDQEKPLRCSKILLLGVAYKPNIDDDRESPSFVLIQDLEDKGAIVSYNDPRINEIGNIREHPNLKGRKSVEVSDEYDLVIIATDHQEYYDIDFTSFQCPIVDTRNCVVKKPKYYYKA